MAQPKVSKISICVVLFCFLLMFASEVQITEAKHCGKPSKSWNGKCFPRKCNHWCKNNEDADYGNCYHGDCYCYYHC
uniref:Defensin-like protein 1 n=2 Tax=Nicotiana TaxID=4085 RepID=A0A1S3ZUF5_TOBAC|nr:PREDICTED: defensin-like protein 1 [Nicotiana sylvestris]XP_016468002.1 PREDICTED: defensin-like protein 1 [Nicotiana tabacum]